MPEAGLEPRPWVQEPLPVTCILVCPQVLLAESELQETWVPSAAAGAATEQPLVSIQFSPEISGKGLPGELAWCRGLWVNKLVQKGSIAPVVSEPPTPQALGASAGRGWRERSPGPVQLLTC